MSLRNYRILKHIRRKCLFVKFITLTLCCESLVRSLCTPAFSNEAHRQSTAGKNRSHMILLRRARIELAWNSRIAIFCLNRSRMAPTIIYFIRCVVGGDPVTYLLFPHTYDWIHTFFISTLTCSVGTRILHTFRPHELGLFPGTSQTGPIRQVRQDMGPGWSIRFLSKTYFPPIWTADNIQISPTFSSNIPEVESPYPIFLSRYL